MRVAVSSPFIRCLTVWHREFLTGFHKRKLAKKEESKKKAIARQKQEHLEARREVCVVSLNPSFHLSLLLSQFRRFVLTSATVATSYPRGTGCPERGKSRRGVRWFRAKCVLYSFGLFSVYPPSGSRAHTHARLDAESGDEEWDGIVPSDDAGREHETAYSDEEQFATVTVMEDFDPSTLLHGPTSSESQVERPPPSRRVSQKEPARNVEGQKTSKRKTAGTNKVRYETRAARRATQAKQHARRSEKAELAGGKAARKTKTGRKKRR